MNNFNRWMIAVTVTLLAITEVLDITIVVVALRNMQGEVGASPTEITWTMTVYIIAAAIFMPLTGYLTEKFGRRRLLFWSAIGFGASSFLCGLSSTLAQIVVFRGLQGAFGAILPALAQSTLLSTFTGKDAHKAMAIFGMGVMLGPVIGPVLGGYITDYMGWRWIFFVNLPVCAIAALLTLIYIDHTPTKPVKNDWLGLGLLALGIGALQFVLDKGSEDGWFDSHTIQLAALISGYTLIVFIVRGIKKAHHVVDFSVFKDRNYMISCIIMLWYCLVIFGTYSWLPLWMETSLNYPASTAGFLLIPRGIMLFLMMGLTPALLKYCDARWLVILACVLYGYASWWMTGYNLLQGPEALFWPNILQGIATGIFFVPLTALTYQTLPPQYLDTASGLFNFFRSMGSSIGVAIFSTIMAQQGQEAWLSMGQHIHSMNPALSTWLNVNQLTLQTPTTYPQLAQIVSAQSTMIAFNDANFMFTLLSFAIIPVVFLIHGKKGAPTVTGH